jgi:hypothetical protein
MPSPAEVLERFAAHAKGEPLPACSAWRRDRRTHQVRVHLGHIGHPLLARRIYGAHFKASARKSPARAGGAERLGRQALHAAELAFVHPVTASAFAFESPLPPDMAELAVRCAGPDAVSPAPPAASPRLCSLRLAIRMRPAPYGLPFLHTFVCGGGTAARRLHLA